MITIVVDQPVPAPGAFVRHPLLGGSVWVVVMAFVLAVLESVPWKIAVAVAAGAGVLVFTPFLYWSRGITRRELTKTRSLFERIAGALVMGATFGATMGVGIAFDESRPLSRTVLHDVAVGALLMGPLFFVASRPTERYRHVGTTDATDDQ